MKKLLTICAATLMLVFAATAFAEDNSVKAIYYIVDCDDHVHLWSTPTTHAGRHLAEIPFGQAVGFIERTRDGNFCKVNYDGIIGYVVSTHLSPTPPFCDER